MCEGSRMLLVKGTTSLFTLNLRERLSLLEGIPARAMSRAGTRFAADKSLVFDELSSL